MRPVGDLQSEMHGGVEAALLVHADVVDVGAAFGDRRRHLGEHPALVDDRHANAHVEHLGGLRRPLDVQPFFGIAARFGGRRAIVGVHDQALAFLDEADDGVARNGVAAARELDREPLGAVYDDRPGRSPGLQLVALGEGKELPRDDRRQPLAQSDIRDDFLAGFRSEVAYQPVPLFGRCLGRFRAQRAHGLIEHALAQRRRLLVLHGLQKVPDLRACLAGLHVREPPRIGIGVRRRDDLDPVSVLELGSQGRELVVDPRRRATIADVGMHGIGEIHRRRAARHRQDFSLGREHVDLVGKQVHLDVFEEFGGIARGVLDIEQRLKPFVGALLHLVELGIGLVQPVRGDAGLGDAAHRLGPDLYLDRHPVGADQSRVQRLIAVHLRDGDVVLELPGHGLVQAVQRAEREVAGGHVLHDDPEAVDIEHLRERQVLVLHLVVDGVDLLLAAGHLRLDL